MAKRKAATESFAEGIEPVLRNLNAKISEIKGNFLDGLFQGGRLIQRRSQTRVPVEYGNLKGSAYTRKNDAIEIEKPELGPTSEPPPEGTVEVGYGAAYAVYVHENMELKLIGKPRPSGLGEYWGPNGEPKFLESAAEESTDDVVRLAAESAKVTA